MRCVSLALTAIGEQHRSASADPIRSRLYAAQAGMVEMAALLESAISAVPGEVDSPDPNESIASAVDRIVERHRPLAGELGIQIATDIAASAAPLPVGPLGMVIQNGLSNAIDACAAGGASGGFVELSASISALGDLLILVSDTGPGLPSDFAPGRSTKVNGHGLGLEVSRKVVESLGGRLRLVNVPFGIGAVLEAAVPLHRLMGR